MHVYLGISLAAHHQSAWNYKSATPFYLVLGVTKAVITMLMVTRHMATNHTTAVTLAKRTPARPTLLTSSCRVASRTVCSAVKHGTIQPFLGTHDRNEMAFYKCRIRL